MPSFIDTATLKPDTRLRITGLDCPEEVLEITFTDPSAGKAMFSHSGAFEGEREGKFVESVLQAEIIDETEPPPDPLRLDGKIVEEAELVYRLTTGERRCFAYVRYLEIMLPGETEWCPVWPWE